MKGKENKTTKKQTTGHVKTTMNDLARFYQLEDGEDTVPSGMKDDTSRNEEDDSDASDGESDSGDESDSDAASDSGEGSDSDDASEASFVLNTEDGPDYARGEGLVSSSSDEESDSDDKDDDLDAPMDTSADQEPEEILFKHPLAVVRTHTHRILRQTTDTHLGPCRTMLPWMNRVNVLLSSTWTGIMSR